MQFTHSGLEGWHVREAEPEDGPRRGEAGLFGIANATRAPMREAERSPQPGTRDPANEEPPRTNALKPAVHIQSSHAVGHDSEEDAQNNRCRFHLVSTRILVGTAPSLPTVCLMDKTLNHLHRG
jgi:hypothetical protein